MCGGLKPSALVGGFLLRQSPHGERCRASLTPSATPGRLEGGDCRPAALTHARNLSRLRTLHLWPPPHHLRPSSWAGPTADTGPSSPGPPCLGVSLYGSTLPPWQRPSTGWKTEPLAPC